MKATLKRMNIVETDACMMQNLRTLFMKAAS